MMNKVFKYTFIFIFIFCIQTTVSAIHYANIEYDIPIDYSKIDKNALANQANQFFNHYEQITDTKYKKKYIQPLLNRYSVLSVIDPSEPLYFTRLGILYDDMENNTYAKSYFYRATNIAPNYSYASYSFGNYYYKRGAFRKALREYKKSSGIQYPYSYDRFIKMASVYEKLGNYKLSLEFYKAAYQEKNSPELYNKILLIEDLNSKNVLYH